MEFLLLAAVAWWLAAPDPVTAGARTASGTAAKAAGAGIGQHWAGGRGQRQVRRTDRRKRWGKGSGNGWQRIGLGLDRGAVWTWGAGKTLAGVAAAAVRPVPAALGSGWAQGRDRHRVKAGDRAVPVALDLPLRRREQPQVQAGEQPQVQAGEQPAEQVQVQGGNSPEVQPEDSSAETQIRADLRCQRCDSGRRQYTRGGLGVCGACTAELDRTDDPTVWPDAYRPNGGLGDIWQDPPVTRTSGGGERLQRRRCTRCGHTTSLVVYRGDEVICPLCRRPEDDTFRRKPAPPELDDVAQCFEQVDRMVRESVATSTGYDRYGVGPNRDVGPLVRRRVRCPNAATGDDAMCDEHRTPTDQPAGTSPAGATTGGGVPMSPCPEHGEQFLDGVGKCVPDCGFGWPSDPAEAAAAMYPSPRPCPRPTPTEGASPVSVNMPSEINDLTTLHSFAQAVIDDAEENGPGSQYAAAAASLSEYFGRDFGREVNATASAFEEAAAGLNQAWTAMVEAAAAMKNESLTAIGG